MESQRKCISCVVWGRGGGRKRCLCRKGGGCAGHIGRWGVRCMLDNGVQGRMQDLAMGGASF